MQTTHLESILQALKSLPSSSAEQTYRVPTLWSRPETGVEEVEPASYFSAVIEKILNGNVSQTAPATREEWKKSAVV